MPTQVLVLSGRSGSNSIINGGYKRLKEHYYDAAAFKYAAMSLFIYKGKKGWQVSNAIGSRSMYAYNEDTSVDSPEKCQKPWLVWDGGDYKSDPNVKISVIEIELAPESAPERVVLDGRVGPNSIINGGYIKMETRLSHDRPVYFYEEANLYLYFRGSDWCIGSQVGTDSRLAFCTDYDAGSPDQIDGVWKVFEAGDWKQDEKIQCEKFDMPGEGDAAAGEGEGEGGLKEEEKFTDSEFPPNAASLADPELESEVEWVRGSELAHSSKCVDKLFDGIEPDDLVQGSLGDCWLIAAISAVAEFRGAIRKLFVTQKFSEEGKYELKLFDASSEKWETIVVDDFIPCKKRKWWSKKGVPMYARPAGNELWCLILEKAFAKFFKGYGKLKGGYSPYAFQCLSGQLVQHIWKKRSAEQEKGADGKEGVACWRRFEVHLPFIKENPRFCQRLLSAETAETVSGGGKREEMLRQLHEVLLSSDKQSFVMSAFILSDRIEGVRQDGLVEMHAYTILRVYSGGSLRLVQLRNPWGRGATREWQGLFSDKSPEWDKHEGLWEKLKDAPKGSQKAKDGKFWMTIDDFERIFDNIQISPMNMKSGQSVVKPGGTKGSGCCVVQ
uniref:Calpain catalytic domain-containing protein n=1 Tax=Chromera velia CCMP2878 TaxID=1169474 RepID=A0A0G4GFI5_9ALVE|eukprot:Cvel_21590.t1-p1 / transcript=Cvel_21590.t1 / gene=Cvel_21590 / organism=Chromera_velia_CCMP2878 / gene_product=Calpain-15, putative / transcript_product=Calpain-15, putative / location=Cvel_scaffold2038:16530-18928(-) / protein_length=610 / sequence_SO=supercontig / SO=protein_coding / is_pseudo=false